MNVIFFSPNWEIISKTTYERGSLHDWRGRDSGCPVAKAYCFDITHETCKILGDVNKFSYFFFHPRSDILFPHTMVFYEMLNTGLHNLIISFAFNYIVTTKSC